VLESADQPGHEPSALTKVGYSVRPGPRVSQPPGLPERHWSANHVHAALSRPAGPARKQAAAKGRPVVSVPEGSRPRAGQVTPACSWAGAATHKHADTGGYRVTFPKIRKLTGCPTRRGPFSDQALLPRRKLRVGSSAPFRRRSRPSHVHVRDRKRLGEVSRVLLASG
jgi:hypothetical protein